jgi:GMP synthase (glutamine-hydrolysing)
MLHHEVECFARHLECGPEQIEVLDLLAGEVDHARIDAADVVLLGGSGQYSVAEGGPWLEPALDAMRELHAKAKPTFASCWGFQAMARAMGGVVVTDITRAEVGTHNVHLTPAGKEDPVLGPLGASFLAQMGHEDIVDRLPEGCTLLASTAQVENQAFRFDDAPIWCTQFHPELEVDTLLDRLRRYPKYIHRITGLPFEEFSVDHVRPADTDELLVRFRRMVVG